MGRILALGIVGALACAPAASAQTGSITGTISTSAKPSVPVRVTIDQKICGSELPDEGILVGAKGQLANAVVIVTGVRNPRSTEALVVNEKCRFAPRVQVARPGANVRTTSRDAILHTTQAQLLNGRIIFNVALPVPGISVGKAIGGANTVRLSCNIHPWMRGWVIVTDEAAAVSGADGRFSIDDVPPGSYELRIWHESLTSAPQQVTIAAGQSTRISFSMK